ncbi:MAG: hypothetical protein J5801_04140 [Bacteroidales bacterium]|nr:hypothetical protein [Bacteroidales bacterium]
MKKIIAILAVAFIGMVAASNANAIEDQWSKGTLVAGVTGGIDPWYSTITFGGLAFGDYVLVDSWWKGHFTVGGQVGFEGGKGWSEFSAAPRVTYGLNLTDKFEVHAGFATGYYFGYWHGFYSSEFIGMHYFFSDAMAFTAQVGYASFSPSVLAGISFKF